MVVRRSTGQTVKRHRMPNQEQTIVVVDDDEGMNQALERLLSAAGFRAVTFLSAEALLETGGADKASCLVLDIHLPGLSGFELQQRLAQTGARLPVIFITAFDDPDSQARAEACGATGYFTKPFSGQKFVAAITKAMAFNRSGSNQSPP